MTSLRDDIQAAIAANAGKSPFPELAPNKNRMGRPPRTIDLSDPDVRRALSQPGLPARLRLMAQDADPETRELVHELLTDLRQFKRAEAGDKALPGEFMGNDDVRIPLPFGPTDSHRPDRTPGTEAHRIYKAAVDQLDADQIATGLAQRMGTQEAVERIEQREDERPPSLRESVAAAFTTHTGINS